MFKVTFVEKKTQVENFVKRNEKMRKIVHVAELTEEGMKIGRETDIEKRGLV
jgi:hypothetical protein